jgi:nucleoside-diphosphate-sugar epimerase
MLWAAHAAGVRHIVYISSLSVYAVPTDGVTITEDSPYESESEARGAYSRSKLAADRVAMDAARRGVPVVVLRPGLLYGPGRRPPLARQSLTVNGFKLLLARPDYCLPMTHVDNVADAVLLATRTAAAVGQAFTVVDENVRQADYVMQYRAAAGEGWRPIFLPVTAVAWGARAVEYGCRAVRRRPPVTYHQVQRATRSAYYDCARAATVLGWRPAIAVADGLRDVFAALRAPAPPPAAAATAGENA